jgi:putative membrane protein
MLLAAAPQVSAGDRAFIEQAVASGQSEIAQASAQANSPDSNVRFYAASIATDHKAIDGRLEKIAKATGVTIRSETSVRRSVPQAPAAYLRSQIDEHEKTIALYRQEAAEGTNLRLRTLANEIVPILQSHVMLAQNLLAQLHGKTTPLQAPVTPFASPGSPRS